MILIDVAIADEDSACPRTRGARNVESPLPLAHRGSGSSTASFSVSRSGHVGRDGDGPPWRICS